MTEGLLDAAYHLISALDVPSDAPASAAARLITIANDPAELTELVVAFKACEAEVMGERETIAPAWRKLPEGSTPSSKWQAICGTFPSLMSNALVREAVEAGRLRDLEQLGCKGETGSGCKHAIRFALSIWNPGFEWECGKFQIIPALKTWDAAHAAAFRAWLVDPWWP